MNKRHHIVIINPDEMRLDTMGHMGNPAAHTPRLDAFAREEAVSFRNAYCQNPVCVPSRCSFFTGLYPHTSGHRTMQYLLHEGESNLFSELKKAGYYVWMNGRNDLVAAQESNWVAQQADEIFYYDENEISGKQETKRELSPLQKALVDKEKYPYSHYMGANRADEDSDVSDTLAAIRRIKTPIPDGKPLCLFLGWVNPHPPYYVEPRYYDLIDAQKIPQRIKLSETQGKSAMIHAIHGYVGMDACTEEDWRELRRTYLAQCAKVDDLFGQVCDALKEAGIYDDTAIFVLSDHGDFAGDYGLPEKAQNTFEDCLTKVPFLIKPPKDADLDPGISDSLVELVDFYATAMDFAGVTPDHDHFSISLRGAVADRKNKVRDFVFCEGGRLPGEWQADECHVEEPRGIPRKGDYWPKQMAQLNAHNHEKGTMIFDGRYKYVERLSGENELYDLEQDPGECVNLYKDHQDSTQVLRLQRAMLHWYQRTCDQVPKQYDSRSTPEKNWSLIRKRIPAEKAPMLKQFILSNPGKTIWEIFGMLQTAGQKRD